MIVYVQDAAFNEPTHLTVQVMSLSGGPTMARTLCNKQLDHFVLLFERPDSILCPACLDRHRARQEAEDGTTKRFQLLEID